MKKIFILFVFCGLVAGCAGTDDAIQERSVKEIYESAYAEFNDEDYEKAAEEFLLIDTQHPTSGYDSDALIMAAYSKYMDEDYAGAILIADRFMRFHPGNAEVPYVLYLRGMCYYNQVSDVRREPGMSVYALQQFENLVQRFPNSKYAENAKNKIIILKNYIAGKVMYAARDDMRNQNWTSAITRLQSVVSTAQETVMTPEALYRLTECYRAIGLEEQVKGFADMLKKNFPDNEWTKKLDKKKGC